MKKRTLGRIVIPRGAKEQLEMSRTLFAKHNTLGGASPLMQLEGLELALTASKIEPALALHETAENMKRQMENAYRQRDVALREIMDVTRKGVQLLKAVYTDNPKKLGEWGINVDDSQQAKKQTKG
ncbi:MAG: hypothetical protein WC716_14295 [Chitinophagaceae bacterium]|jgi:hypothetical protein